MKSKGGRGWGGGACGPPLPPGLPLPTPTPMEFFWQTIDFQFCVGCRGRWSQKKNLNFCAGVGAKVKELVWSGAGKKQKNPFSLFLGGVGGEFFFKESSSFGHWCVGCGEGCGGGVRGGEGSNCYFLSVVARQTHPGGGRVWRIHPPSFGSPTSKNP